MNIKGKGDGKLTDRIRQLAVNNNTNIKRIEQKCNLSNGSIRRWDESMPTIDNLAAVAKEFDVSIDYLYFGKKEQLDDKDSSLLSYFHELPDTVQRSCITYMHGIYDSYRIMKEESN